MCEPIRLPVHLEYVDVVGQAVEKRAQVTRQCIEVLRDANGVLAPGRAAASEG